MKIIQSIALASALTFLFAGSPAYAANVYGIGQIDTNLGPPLESVLTEYEDSDFLDVGKIVQLNGSEAGGNIPVGNKDLSYFGDAQFGRLAATSRIGGQVPASPDLSTSVSFSMGFLDQIDPEDLNPLSGNNLRLDVELRGEMTGYGATNNGASIGKSTNGLLEIRILDVDSMFAVGLASVGFSWFGESFLLTNTSQNSTPRFVPYPGEEPGFTQNPIPGPPRHFFGARGYVDIPLNEGSLVNEEGDPIMLFGEPFVLEVGVIASSSCGNEVPECLAITRFTSARIDNARLVDHNGDPIPGASFTSTSGHDYVVPEPQAFAMILVAIVTLASLRRRLRPGDAACPIASSNGAPATWVATHCARSSITRS